MDIKGHGLLLSRNNNFMKITYDPEADAAYIKIRNGNIHRTRKISNNLLVDVNRKGNVLGIELLFVSSQV